MRLEIIIPDSTRPAVKEKLTQFLDQLRARPEMIEEIQFYGQADDADIQRLFTPERLAIIDAADADMDAGNFRTLEQVDERIAATRARWLATNPS